jgi:hypothetical protein
LQVLDFCRGPEFWFGRFDARVEPEVVAARREEGVMRRAIGSKTERSNGGRLRRKKIDVNGGGSVGGGRRVTR